MVLNFWEIFGPSVGVYPKETWDAFSDKEDGKSRPCILKSFGYNYLFSSKTRHVSLLLSDPPYANYQPIAKSTPFTTLHCFMMYEEKKKKKERVSEEL